MGEVVVGTCSWTDKTMIERWYPPKTSSPEARLRYYAARYDTVEVDSTFYGLPREDYARHWAERTPDGFTFHIKAYGLMTGHEVDERSLAPELRDYDYELTHTGRVRHPEQRMIDRSFELFVDALQPLVRAGKMGGVLMQYPAYMTAIDRQHAHANLEVIDRAAAILDPLPVFVEFRHASWVTGPQLEQTMKFLSDRNLTYVAVDAPRIPGSAVMPPVTAATSRLGYVRFHGRNAGTWNVRTASAADRFDYVYDRDELAEWTEPIGRLAGETERTWVMFNNCKYDYAPRNAREMAEILGDVVAPREGGTKTGEPIDGVSSQGDSAGEQATLF
ncbi:MAG: DUF72 domain-containing protein [Coriobacteriia bacterium]|nr:DUF72 domain-containing protein [Coriobacteriia bacterium]